VKHVRIIKILLGCILIFSGIAKIVDPSKSVNLMIEFRIIPQGLIVSIISFLTVVEIFIGLLLVTGVYLRIAIISALVLFIGFFFISIYGAILGFNVDCGCFGSVIKSQIGLGMILRNGAFIVVTVYAGWRKFIIKKMKFVDN